MSLLKHVFPVLGLCAAVFAQEATFNLAAYAQSELVEHAPWFGDQSGGARGIISGVDLDQDGKQEIWVTDYSYGGRVHCFEMVGTDSLALVWSSAVLDTTTYGNENPRWVQTGDMDADGNGEVIFFAGRYFAEQDYAGLYVYEWTGSDNDFGSQPAYFVNLFAALNDTLTDMRIEHFTVNDVDSDGQEEIIVAINGPTEPSYGSKVGTNFSEDRFIILSIDGPIGSGFETLIEEYSISPRDVDKDGTNENALLGGSPQAAIVADTDGDGKKEIACVSYRWLAVFFIEAVAAGSYTIGDTTVVALAYPGGVDDWTLGGFATDADSDGRDEVYVPGFYNEAVYVIGDADGDATHLDKDTETGRISHPSHSIFAGGSAAPAGIFSPYPSLFFGGSAAGDGDIIMFTFNGGDPLDSLSWDISYLVTDSAAGGGAHKLFAGADLDADNFKEIVLGYQGIEATSAKRWIVRVAEYSEVATEVRPITVIMPTDYKLEAAYPNPFNPTTTIEYILPMSGEISLVVYNILGEEVVRLVDHKVKEAGTHEVVWDGRDSDGSQVASGTYMYVLKFGNYFTSRRVTLLK